MSPTLNDIAERARAFARKPSVLSLFPITHKGLKWSDNYLKARLGRAVVQQFDALLAELPVSRFHIDEEAGYASFDMSGHPVMKAALALCHERYSKDKVVEHCSHSSKKNTLLSYRLDLSDPVNAPILELAGLPEFVKPVGDYIGTFPVLLGAYVWFSRNDQEFDLVASQLHHFDREGLRQVKCFIPIEEIDEESGPLTAISAADSRHFISWLAENNLSTSLKQRFTDDLVRRALGDHAEVKLTGKPGNVVLVDTTNCLHYGSRPGKRPKYHITLHYVSPFSPKLSDMNWRRNFAGNAESALLAAQGH